MATDANTLLAEVKCFECSPPGQWQLLKLGLLKQILLANDSMADTSPSALLEAAKCYACSPPGFWMLYELALLQQIVANGGGGGGSGTIQVYTGAAPPAAPDDPTKPALWYPTGGGGMLQWDGAAWV